MTQTAPRLKFLVADRAASVAVLVAELLTEAGAEVVATAADGAQALQLFDQAGPDAVVLDLAMPRLNGIELLKAIRSREKAAGCASHLLIVLTSHHEPSLREQCMEAGADHFLLKSCDFERLLEIVPAYTAQLARRVPVAAGRGRP